MTKAQQLKLDITPGVILREEFMEPLGVTQAQLARETGLPESRLSNVLGGKRAITAETAIALSTFFGNSPDFWLNLQTRYDLDREEIQRGKSIRARVRPLTAA